MNRLIVPGADAQSSAQAADDLVVVHVHEAKIAEEVAGDDHRPEVVDEVRGIGRMACGGLSG